MCRQFNFNAFFSEIYHGYHRRPADCQEPAFDTVHVSSLDECIDKCDQNQNCAAVAFASLTCELRGQIPCLDLKGENTGFTVYYKIPVTSRIFNISFLYI